MIYSVRIIIILCEEGFNRKIKTGKTIDVITQPAFEVRPRVFNRIKCHTLIIHILLKMSFIIILFHYISELAEPMLLSIISA